MIRIPEPRYRGTIRPGCRADVAVYKHTDEWKPATVMDIDKLGAWVRFDDGSEDRVAWGDIDVCAPDCPCSSQLRLLPDDFQACNYAVLLKWGVPCRVERSPGRFEEGELEALDHGDAAVRFRDGTVERCPWTIIWLPADNMTTVFIEETPCVELRPAVEAAWNRYCADAGLDPVQHASDVLAQHVLEHAR